MYLWSVHHSTHHVQWNSNVINILKFLEYITLNYRPNRFHAALASKWHPRSVLCQFKIYTEHINKWFGEAIPLWISSTAPCRPFAPAYTAPHVAHVIIPDSCDNPTLNSKWISTLVRSKQIYKRDPAIQHYHAIRRQILRLLDASRVMKMSVVDVYNSLLRHCGHKCKLHFVDRRDWSPSASKHRKILHIMLFLMKQTWTLQTSMMTEYIMDFSLTFLLQPPISVTVV